MSSIAWFVTRRLAASLLVMLLLSFTVFVVFYAIPGDPARLSCGRPCTPDRLEQVRHFMQLDRSVIQQYLDFLRGIVAGRTFGEGLATAQCPAPCFGYSFPFARPVTTLIAGRLPVTASLAIGAAVLWLVGGVALGTLAALRRNRLADRVVTGVALVSISAPTFLVGLLAILLFGFVLNVVPVNGYVPLTEDPVQWLWHLVTPWATLALLSAAAYIRLTRAQLLEELGQDFVTTARAKGAGPRRVVFLHALRGVLVPIITIFGLDLGGLLGGAVITERVFSMQGLGELLINAVGAADLPVVVGTTLFAAFLVILANLVVDLVHGLLDPRVGHG